jgi:WD40 repeat protein
LLCRNNIISALSYHRFIDFVKDFNDEIHHSGISSGHFCRLKRLRHPPSTKVTPPVAEKNAVTVIQPLKRQLAEGLYEMALSPQGDALYVASAEGFKDVRGGLQAGPENAEYHRPEHTDLKNFAVQISPEGKTLFVSNSLDGGISAIDTATGKVKNRLLFSERNEKVPYGARQILLLNNTLYVGAVADPAQIWVVDATTLKLKTRIKNTGKWMTGLHYSAQTGRCTPLTAAVKFW